MLKDHSLKGALQITIAILVIIVGLAISQFVTQRYSAVLFESAIAKAENIAHKLAVDSADLILINDLVTLQKVIDNQLLSTPSVAYIFVEKNRRILAHSFSRGIPSALIAANTPLDTKKGRVKKIISEKSERFLDIAWPIFNNHAGVLRLGLSEELYRDQARRLWIQMNLITAGIIAAFLVIIHLFISYLTRPLSVLADQVEQIDEGKLETKIAVRGRQEVSKLTRAFNSLLDRIHDYTLQLNKSNIDITEKHEELSRAHRQLNTSFTISKDIAGLPKLHDICAYLLKTFRNILSCQQMVFLIFSQKQHLYLLTDYEIKRFGKTEFDFIQTALTDIEPYQFVSKELLHQIPHPLGSGTAGRLAVFPLRMHGLLLGSLVIGCSQICACKKEELSVIEPILRQSANAVERALTLEEEMGQLNSNIDKSNQFRGLIGKDSKMQGIFKLIENVSATEAGVLIQGESGTGKELVARAIHDCSPRKDNPFIVINCSAYPSTLLESELFGHEKGAFTGATRRKAGRFEQADGGTVFLDEIGEISPSAQIKLLRVLQSRKFERLGGEETLSIDVRVLAATNKDLSQEVQTGSFREDLFYRLNVILINMPPLRDRRNDIIILAKHFLNRFSNEQQKSIQRFASEAMHHLINYTWPGNVRELENTIEHAVVLAKGESVEVLDLPLTIIEGPATSKDDYTNSISQSEERIIREALDQCNWNKSKAAEKIGISRGTLYQKIKKYQILN